MEKSRVESGFWEVVISGRFYQNIAFIKGFDRSIARLEQIEKDLKKTGKKEGDEAEKKLRDRV
ncbi:hypothetical protein GCM10027454_08940 [Algoriphagus aestuariicola]|jgi:hypothetical protein